MEGGGRTTLSEIYQNSKKLLLRTRDGLERLERLEFSSSNPVDSPELSLAVKKDISQIQSLCVEMDHLWRSIAAKSQRDLWRRLVFSRSVATLFFYLIGLFIDCIRLFWARFLVVFLMDLGRKMVYVLLLLGICKH